MEQAREPNADEGLIPRDSNEFDRGISYFDAIYGFAVTLLVANLDAPDPEAWRSMQALSESGLGAQLLGLVLSFVVITALWRVNVRLVKRLEALDGPTMIANIAAAGLIIVIPFTTQGISDPHSSVYALPTVFYALNIAAVSLTQTVMFQLGRRAGLEKLPTTERENTIALADAAVTPVVFLASIPLALFIAPEVAQLSWLTLIVALPVAGALRARLSDQTA